MRRRLRTLVPAFLLSISLAAPAPSVADEQHAEQQMIEAINDFRHAHGRRALRASGSLHGSANDFAGWLMAHDYFGHVGHIRASRSFRRLGEVIELHGGSSARVRRTVRRWARSPGHRAVLLSRGFRQAGAGMSTGRFRGHVATIWVVHVGAR